MRVSILSAVIFIAAIAQAAPTPGGYYNPYTHFGGNGGNAQTGNTGNVNGGNVINEGFKISNGWGASTSLYFIAHDLQLTFHLLTRSGRERRNLLVWRCCRRERWFLWRKRRERKVRKLRQR